MTAEMQDTLRRELADAKAIEDEDRRRDAMMTVQSHMLEALIDCQKKTADRVKELVAGANAAKYKLEGAQLAWRVFRYLAAGGAGAAIVKFAGKAAAGAQ